MARLRILSERGDTTVEWDVSRVEAGDPDALAAVREAERIFREQLRRGSAAFKVEPGQPVVKLEEFDPKAQQMIVLPRVAGG